MRPILLIDPGASLSSVAGDTQASSAASISMAPSDSLVERFSALGKLSTHHLDAGKCGSIGLRFSLFSQTPALRTTKDAVVSKIVELCRVWLISH